METIRKISMSTGILLCMMKILILLLAAPVGCTITTKERIRNHGYPVEKHTVQTADGYILTMFRIPHPPNTNSTTTRPIAFFQHGILCSSDCWILKGPGAATVYMLVDAGYDVWLGNNRGNTYSKKHVQYRTLFPRFWNFEWHQIALYDMPAMIDYVLFYTDQKSLHYIAHSQGTTIFFVMTSMIPHYNDKIKSAQLLAPVAFLENPKGFPFTPEVAAILGQPNALVELFGSMEILPNNTFSGAVKAQACIKDSLAHHFLLNLLLAVAGWKHSLDMTIFCDIVKTYPAGSSLNQLIHFLQLLKSKEFRQFDHGFLRNKFIYGQYAPPNYDLQKVTAPTFLYYADNDIISSPIDVLKLITKLPNVQYSFKVTDPKWNHVDHLWGINVKIMISDRILENVNKIESSKISH